MLNDLGKKDKNLILLPHLDDEFALSPLLRILNKENTKIVFCAERLNSNIYRLKKRRKESILSISYLGFQKSQVSFLNDYFEVNDGFLFKSSKNIYDYLCKICSEEKFTKLFTLTFEGGHPDHDSLALIVDKFCKRKNLKKFFFPAYNYNNFFLIPFSALMPLKTIKFKSKFLEIRSFCWIDAIKIGYIYKTEILAFIKLLPFILLMFFLKNGIYYFENINLNDVDWQSSLSFKRYKTNLIEIINETSKL